MSFVKVVNGKALGGGEAEGGGKETAPTGPVGGAEAG